jgi:hypothetical protein
MSVSEKTRSMGIEPVPSAASLAGIFGAAGVGRLEPKKKPREAHRGFVSPAPNARGQLDTTGYVLVGGRKCLIYPIDRRPLQARGGLIDGHQEHRSARRVAMALVGTTERP